MEIAEARKKLRDDPNDALALKRVADYYLKEGHYKQSQALYAKSARQLFSLLPEILLDYEAAVVADPEKIGPRYSLAGFLVAMGEIDSAKLELEEILETFPKKAETYQALGRIFIKEEKIDEAINILEKSIGEGVEDINLREILAFAYLEKGRLHDAIRFYEEILALKPGDKQTLRILGELYHRTENYLLAARSYQAMFSDDPEVVREVIQRLEELLKKVEGSIEIREILAEIYIRTMNPEAAVARLREILRLESSKLEEVIARLRAILKSYPNLPPAVLALGEGLKLQGNYSEAVEIYHQLLRDKPQLLEDAIQGYRDIIQVCPGQVLAHSYLGEALLHQNKVTEALHEFGSMVESDPAVAEIVIKRCREVLKVYPQLVDARVTLGKALLARGDYQKAAAEAETVLTFDKKKTGAYLLLGEAYTRMKMTRKAAEAMRSALLLEPYSSEVHARNQTIKEKELEAEIASLKEKLQEDQWKLSLHLDLGKIYFIKGDNESAIREFQQAQKDAPRAAAAYLLLGNVYRGDGRFDLAATQYNRGIESNPADLLRSLRLNLGTTHEAQGEVRKAIRLYEEILQEDIDFGNLRSRVKLLKATHLPSMRTKPLQAVITDYQDKKIIALWGREEKNAGRSARREEVSVSFGQEHNQAGFDFFMKGMDEAAAEEFALAVQLDPHFAVAINNLAVSLMKAGRLEEARLKLIEAVQLDPASSINYSNLGVVYYLQNKYESAATALEKSYSLNSESSPVCLNLGDIYYLLGKSEKAIELYRRIGSFDTLSDLVDRRLLYKSAGGAA